MGIKAELHHSTPMVPAASASSRPRSSLRQAELPAIVLSLSLLLLLVISLVFRPVHFHITGVPCRLARGATAADALTAIGLKATAGDLLDVRGRVLRPGGGLAAMVVRDGQPLKSDAPIRHDDVLAVVPAANVTEPVRERTSLLEAPEVAGYAPPAVTGTQRLRVGLLSGLAVVETTAAAPTVRAATPTAKPKLVALTFDDGPWPGTTAQVLDILAKHRARATFFVIGAQSRGRPELIRRTAEEGHELGVHTWAHANLARTSAGAIVSDLNRCRKTLEELTGKPIRLMRPPYGALNARARSAIAQTGLRIVMWTADTNDWKKPGSGVIYSRIMNGARNGAIILCHDGGGSRASTVSAVSRAVPALQQRGYELVTVSQLLGLESRPAGGAIVLADGRRLEVKSITPKLTVLVDDKPAVLPEEPVEIEGQLLVPVRPLLDLLGLKWTWSQQAQTLTLTGPFERLVTRVNSLKIETGPGVAEELPAPPILYRGSLLAPLWVVLSAGQATATYDPAKQALRLISFDRAMKTGAEGVLPPEQWGRGVRWREYLSGQ